MDELLAHLAEQGPSLKNTVRCLLGARHNLLRRLGLAKLTEYNDMKLVRT